MEWNTSTVYMVAVCGSVLGSSGNSSVYAIGELAYVPWQTPGEKFTIWAAETAG